MPNFMDAPSRCPFRDARETREPGIHLAEQESFGNGRVELGLWVPGSRLRAPE